MNLRWYGSRLRSMDAGEIAWRCRNAVLQRAWQSRMGERWVVPTAAPRWAGGRVRAYASNPEQTEALMVAAEAVLAGNWTVFGKATPIAGEEPDWFRDAATGLRAPNEAFCFSIPYRDEARVGNVKYVWELSRLHHVTLLAAAYHCTGRAAFADRAVAHLQSWWRANPPLCGIHWVSGIEIGLRLIAWVWTRRLLDGYPDVKSVFERNESFQRQLHAHQAWLATFESRRSSANNHVIAEMSGQLVAALAFPLFPASSVWAATAKRSLEREIGRQTFEDGMHRELASAYHVFVLELLLIAAVEADAAGSSLSDHSWVRLRAMADALAATVDTRLQTARQGDGDDGRGLLLDPPETPGAEAVLGLSARVFGAAEWWPDVPQDGMLATVLASHCRPRLELSVARAARRPNQFPDAGVAVIRDPLPGPDEIWCRIDAGPHGYLSTAAHAHADALSFELRIGGQPVLVDPGTYCYHGEPVWRDYFRSTVAHNTLELDHRDQAVHAGPFLWLTRPNVTVAAVSGLDDGNVAAIEAHHDGYRRGERAPIHHRRLSLDRHARAMELLDWIDGGQSVAARLSFSLHPDIACELAGWEARLSWADGPVRRSATLHLEPDLVWTAHRGETDPILGWYSPYFGCKLPTVLLLGVGRIAPGEVLRNLIALPPRVFATQQAA